MADAAWTKVFQDDLLHGCRAANMTAEEIGVYCTVLWLIASRGAPIEFDSRWIAGFAGVTPRKATTIINKLAAMRGKLVVRNGMIGNHKMLRTVAERDRKSDQAREAARARWHGDEAELPLDKPRQKQADKLPDNRSDNREIIKPIKKPKPQKSAVLADADASPLVRARDSETQIDSTNEQSESTRSDAVRSIGSNDAPVAEPDIAALWGQVSEAAGFVPTSASRMAEAIQIVTDWRSAGIDFPTIVLPTIRAVIAGSHDPTSSLRRFDAKVRHAHARSRPGKTNGSAPATPPAPIIEPPDEDPMFRPLRAALLERFGPTLFAQRVNGARFVDLGDQQGKRVMRVQEGKLRLMDDRRPAAVKAEARKMGFDDVW